MGFLDFVKYLFNDIPLDYQGPEAGWYVVPNYSQFTYSSVRGDFRLVPLADGCFAAAWKDFVQVRDLGGRALWRADWTGHTVAPSADGRQLLAFSTSTEELTRYEARSGRVLASAPLPPLPLPDAEGSPTASWPEQLIGLPDGTVAVLLHESVGILAADGHRWQAYYQGFLPPREFAAFLSGMSWQPARPQELLVYDLGDSHVVVLDLATGQVLRQGEVEAYSALPGPHGQQPLLYHYGTEAFLLLDPLTLGVAKTYPFPGLEGVRTEAENQHQRSSTAWENRAVLSPNGKYLLAADRSGLVWLFDAHSGYKLRIFRRELINHAYDLAWLNDQVFLALTNRGHVVKIDITQQQGLFDVTDFTADDDARHLLSDSCSSEAGRRSAPDEAAVLAALDTLATTPDPNDYAEAWETIHFAPADFDWRAHLTPARLDGALRQYGWMLPVSGFAVQGVFERLRQLLLAVQYHVPAAPVAPVLALHDSVFGPMVTFETLEAEFVRQDIEAQLAEAYHLLGGQLASLSMLDEETGKPFVLSPVFAEYEQMVAEANGVLSVFAFSFGWEAHNVVERAFPALAVHFARRLGTFPAPVQRRMLQGVRYHDDPSAVALMRQLAEASPHQDIRAFASRALADASH